MQNKKSVLIVGDSSYLSSGIEFDKDSYFVDKIRRPFELNDKSNYKKYDYVINFCIQPEHFTKALEEREMIDVQIAKEIANTNTKFVFLSSRKVYGSNFELKEYKETDELKPYDFYSENKTIIENNLQRLIPDNLLILRTGNIIGEPTPKKNYKTFIGWIEKELEEKNRVSCTILPDTRKDFVTKNYFQKVLKKAVEEDLTGIYNVGAGFALPMKDILLNLLSEKLVDFSHAVNQSEQFILNTDKIKKYINEFTEQKILAECLNLNEYFLDRFLINSCVR